MSQRSFTRAQQRKAAASARREALMRRRRAGLLAGAAIGATALFAPAAHAATFQVTSLADGAADTCAPTDCTLREAVAAANAAPGDDTVTFASTLTGTIHLDTGQGPIVVGTDTETLAISGPGADRIQVDGGGDTLLFRGTGDGALAVSGLGLQNGSGLAAGAVYLTGDMRLALTGDVLSGNAGTYYDAAGAVNTSGDVTVTGSTFTANHAYYAGGAIAAHDRDATVVVSGSTFVGNSASARGGALYLAGPGADISDSGFTGNSANLGGAVDASSTNPVAISHSTLNGNTAAVRGGAVSTHDGTALSVTDSTLAANVAHDADGGGVYALGDTTVSGSHLTGNTAGQVGGGLYAAGSLHVGDSVVSGNTASRGGGIAASVGGLHGPNDITRTTISGNHARDGGGVRIGDVEAGAQLRVDHTTISGNEALGQGGDSPGLGGGLVLAGSVRGTLRLRESTISGNRADLGGGISLRDSDENQPNAVLGDGSIDLDNSTIAANTATLAGGGIELDRSDPAAAGGPTASTIGLTSTVVADNIAAGAGQDLHRADDTTGGGFDLRFGLVEGPGTAPLVQHPAAPSILGVDPQLGPLAANGGPTQTQAPARTSPLVDQGHAPATDETDQRGSARTFDAAPANPDTGDGTDIGAVELDAAAFVIPVVPVPTPDVPPAPVVQAPQQFFATVAGRALNTRGPANSLRTVVASLPGVTCSVSRDTIKRCTVAIRSTAAVRVAGRTAPLPKGTLLASGSSSAAGSVASLLVKVKLTSAGTRVLATRPLGVIGGATVSALTSAGTPQVQAAVRLLRSNSIRILVPGRPATLPPSVVTQIDAAAKVFRSAITVECSAYSDTPRGALTLTTMQAKLACARVAKVDVDATLTPRGHSASHRLAPGASAARRALSRRIVLRFGL